MVPIARAPIAGALIAVAAGSAAGPIVEPAKPRRASARSIFLGIAIGLAWCALLAVGWWQLLRYTYRPATLAAAVSDWPSEATFAPRERFRVVMFVHPMCPCSRASIQELDNSLARMPAEVSATVVAVTAGLDPQTLESSRLITELRDMPRIRLYTDEAGLERQRFGAIVSGEVFAFGRDGRRVFHGGLTPGRGHVGESAGQGELEALARGERAEPCEAPVFGCRLPAAGRP